MGQAVIPAHVFTPPEKTWMDRAACKGMDVEAFYSDLGFRLEEAKDICRSCSVREDCLEFALANNEAEGLWGGKTAQERKRERRRRMKESLPERRELAQ